MSSVILQGVEKAYGRQLVVRDCDLNVADGEFLSLLGPSGCGKTTTLRMIAGLDEPSAGVIAIGDQVMADAGKGVRVPPERRQIGMVFQSYAVWPHMTVRENVGYPLKLRGAGTAALAAETDRALELVQMQGLAGRYPHELSGGQQQRVALARALAMAPRVLLLDEPLSNLDAKLREEMRVELKALQQRLRMTVIYVTHDQTEALALSDRVAVMEGGVIRQLGPPREIYEWPASPFVADFVGGTNLLPGRLLDAGEGGRGRVRLQAGTGPLDCRVQPGAAGEVLVSVRPECVTLGPPGGPLEGDVAHLLYLGDRVEVQIRLGDARVRVYLAGDCPWRPGDRVGLAFHEAVAFHTG